MLCVELSFLVFSFGDIVFFFRNNFCVDMYGIGGN